MVLLSLLDFRLNLKIVGVMSPVEKWPARFSLRLSDAQLVDYHMRRKLNGETQTSLLIPELNIYKCEPWNLFSKYDGMVTFILNPFSPGSSLSEDFNPCLVAELSDVPSDGQECFFFCPRRNKNPNSRRFTSKRTTVFGYWDETGKKRPVRAQNTGKKIGTKSIFVYHQGRRRKGCNRRTNMVMHEYHLNSDVPASTISSPVL